jgi:beta-glucosidase
MNNINSIIANLTLEEKASLCSGDGMWHTQAIEREVIPGLHQISSIMVSDGPYGLRKQNLSKDGSGMNDSIRAICFPAACLTACSFDRKLLLLEGKLLGVECVAEDVAILLGPGVNIKRSPLCGRNFEYFSEDPYLSGEMGSSWIQGVQSQNIGTSVKHYAANSQEYRRLSSSSEVDERTLREIYLPAFEKAVKEGNPDSVMCSYNRINGVYASENEYLLTKILRDEWNFKGIVISDWGSVSDRVTGLKAGLDLEMPGSRGNNDKLIVAAVKNGTLNESILDATVERILRIVFKYMSGRNGGYTNSGIIEENANNFDYTAHHKFAVKIAQESMVLLKNNDIKGKVLPLNIQDSQNIVFIGDFAKNPRFQGGGSSHINTKGAVSVLEAAKKVHLDVQFVPSGNLKQAVKTAQSAKIAVIFAGLPDSYESEGFDRTHMHLPEDQNLLIESVATAQPRTVVVLQNGSPIEMPWIEKIPAILECYLGGEGVGEATINLLFGFANPCGKLAETFPLRSEDNPSYLNFANDTKKVHYTEGIFVGYRWYDAKNLPVLFPFGHGLSYTQFEYTNLKLSVYTVNNTSSTRKKDLVMTDDELLHVSFVVHNTGTVAGKEIVQLYVQDCASIEKIDGAASRPPKELKNFTKVELNPKESKLIFFTINKRDLCWYNKEIHDWYTSSGKYRILIGASSRDIRLSDEFNFKTNVYLPFKFTRDSVVGDIMNHPIAAKLFTPYLEKMSTVQSFEDNSEDGHASEAITHDMIKAMIANNPLRSVLSFTDMDTKKLDSIIDDLNAKLKEAGI